MQAVRPFVGWSVSVTALLLLAAYPPDRLSAQDYRAQALRILKTVPLIDGHNDIPDAIRERGGLDSVDFAVLQPKLMSDIPKLRAGGVGAPSRTRSARCGCSQRSAFVTSRSPIGGVSRGPRPPPTRPGAASRRSGGTWYTR